MEQIGMIFAAVILALGLSACMQEDSALDKAPGTYVSESKSTDSAGTTRKNQTVTTVSEDEYGRRSATVTNKGSTDPRGLFNKSTSTDTTTIRQ
jgi:hypothetical protein